MPHERSDEVKEMARSMQIVRFSSAVGTELDTLAVSACTIESVRARAMELLPVHGEIHVTTTHDLGDSFYVAFMPDGTVIDYGPMDRAEWYAGETERRMGDQ